MPASQCAVPNPQSAIPLILLAAGGSTRMGRPKQLLPYGNTTLLRHAAKTALASGCSPIVVVLGAAAEIVAGALVNFSVDAVINPHWSSGMGTSLRLGLQTVLEASDPSAVVVMLCDQPAVIPELIRQLVDQHRAGATLVAAEYAGIPAVPALIGREWFNELLTLPDDAGARFLLNQHAELVETISFPDGALDVDTPEDYQQLLLRRRPQP